MPDNYDRILEGGADLLNRLSPHGPGGDHCVEAADAVHDFLTTGVTTPVQAGFGIEYRLHQDVLAGFRRITLPEALGHILALGHAHHIVLRATRTRPRPGETTHHYFVLANIHGLPVVIDAYGHLLVRGEERILVYVRDLIGIPPGYLEYSARDFDVEVRNPLEELFPDGL